MHPRPTAFRRVAATLGTVLLCLPAAACAKDNSSNTGQPEPTPPPTSSSASSPTSSPAPTPDLETWATDFPAPAEEDWIWSDEDTAAVLTDPWIVAYDRSTGEERWTVTLPANQRYCAISDELNDDHIGAVILGKVRGPCTEVAALDTTTGKFVWKSKLDGELRDSSYNDLTLTEATVVAQSGYEVHRFDLATGKPLAAIAPEHSGAIYPGGAIDGELILQVDGPDSEVLTAYNADTGTRLWSHRSDGGVVLGTHGVLSQDPLVVDVTMDGRRGFRTFDGRGRVGATFGKDEDPGASHEPPDAWVANGVLVAAYDATMHKQDLVGYDISDGKRLWRLAMPEGEQLVGLDAGLVTVRYVKEAEALQGQLVRRSLETGDDPEVLGYLSENDLPLSELRMNGDLVIDTNRVRVRTYPLPPPGQ